jgi:predicted nuclease with TOPRIM domain
MTKKTKTATLEIDSEEPETKVPETVGETTDDAPEAEQPETEVPEKSDAPVELSQDQKIEAYLRKEQVLRDAQTELENLEDEQAEARREMNSYKKPIADARSKVSRLISCDVHGFLQWEKEQELPLIRKAEEAANAWRDEPVEKLDVMKKHKKPLAKHFKNCGAVAEWLGKSFPEKKAGLNGDEVRDHLTDAINKISGTGETK